MDLFQRISTLHLHLPPLRERMEDAAVLFEYFLTHNAGRHYRHIFDFTPEKTGKILAQYDWPGNIRELEHFCVKLLTGYDTIDDPTIEKALTEHRRMNWRDSRARSDRPEDLLDIPLFYEATEAYERLYIMKSLKENGNDVRQSADAMGLNLSTLYKKLRKYGIPY